MFRHKEERYIFFLFWLYHLHPPQHVWHLPQRSPQASQNQPSSPEAGLISTHWLSQNLPKSSTRFRFVTSSALCNPRFSSRAIVTSLSDTSTLRTRAWTPVLMLHQRSKPHPNECAGYDTKQTDGEVPVMLELWGMGSTPSLPSLPDPLWPWVIAPDKGPIYGLNRTKLRFLDFTVFVFKLRIYAKLNCWK